MRSIAVLMLAACSTGPETTDGPLGGPSLGGQSGEDPGGCLEEVRVVGPDDPVDGAAGPFTATGLRTLAEGAFDAVLGWDDGTSTGVVVTLTWDGEARAYEPIPSATTSTCSARIELYGTYAFRTDDGAFDETGEAVLAAGGPTSGGFGDHWEEGTLGGTFPFPDDPATHWLRLHATVDDAGVRGDLTLAAVSEPSCGVIGETSGSPVATFGPE